MKKLFILLSVAVLALTALPGCSSKYETVKGDPLQTKIYTLDNGLKVYMSVNKEAPRIQTYIAVRVGGKNDPSDNTGLAHYLEHIMFKGTESFGTSDYAAEKPYLDRIEELFNVYRTKTDPAERAEIYRQIDEASYQASQIAIPNEYDKLMALIGAEGTNAFTSNDVTCYTEDIPSNQVENWAKVQADRFKNLVVRGFHTELEAVYEEYNMYLNEDSENAQMAIDSVLFSRHPYGLQAVIGTQEHLKNPSISAIKKQKALYYVPNNTAICVSGDFDPDEFVKIIEKYFGDWQPNPQVPAFSYEEEPAITAPVEKVVYGTEAEFVMMGWRYPGSKDLRASEVSAVVSEILYNGQAGLIDIDVNQQQKALMLGAQAYDRVDYGEFLLIGYPKAGQTLQEVRDIALAEVAKLRDGDFSEDVVTAAVANLKLQQMRALERNRSRVSMYMDAFISGVDWAEYAGQIDRLSKVTKQDVVDWAARYLGAQNYVLAYKRLGENPKNNKLQAPKITPIATNRDKQSDFLTEVQQSEVAPIEPVFVDYAKDLSRFSLRDGIDVLYKQNTVNDIASLTLRFDTGLLADPALGFAFDYLSYLGTATRSAEELASEEYKLACSHSFRVDNSTAQYSITGLGENIAADLVLVEDLIANAVPDEAILENLKADLLTSRMVAKQTQGSCNSALRSYVMYGPEYVKATTLTDGQLMALTSEELLGKVRALLGCAHRVLYYGPADEAAVKTLLSGSHKAAERLTPLEYRYARRKEVSAPKVYIAPYESRQFNYIQYSDRGERFSLADAAQIELFNQYFGGGMNTVVFQEMREARALAYSAGAYLSAPSYPDDSYAFYATIGSQNDKLVQAVTAFDEIINDMPESDKAFDIAKTSLESMLRTTRTTGSAVLSSYLTAERLGLSEPVDKVVFESLSSLSLESLMATQQKWVKGRTYEYGLLGDPADLDQQFLRTLGPVQILSLEDIFGY